MRKKNKIITDTIRKVFRYLDESKQVTSYYDRTISESETSLRTVPLRENRGEVYDLRTATKYIKDQVIRPRLRTGQELEKKMNADNTLVAAVQIALERTLPDVLDDLRNKTITYETVLMTLKDEIF